MTNKTEMVSVPRALLACYLSGDGGDWVEAGHELRVLLAAPAEDVRAVVDEPFDMADAYVGAREELLIWKKRALEAEAKVRTYDGRIVALGVLGMQAATSHPQRQVVLPERRNVDPNTAETILQWHKDCEWNACLEEIEKLNK